MRLPAWFLFLLGLSIPAAAWSATQDSAGAAHPTASCETAIASAESAGRLPPHLLKAIGLTETGRTDPSTGDMHPWPWTINAEGQGQFFATKIQAISAAQALQARGVRSIDVGCLQVSLLYHPDAFATLADAFDPRANATYAARFLNALYAGSRNWAHAIAAYHSETPALGEAYRTLVMARWQGTARHAVPPSPAAYQDWLAGRRS